MSYRNIFTSLLICLSGSKLGKLSSEQKGKPSDAFQLDLHDNTLIVPRFDEHQVMSFTIERKADRAFQANYKVVFYHV